MLRTTLCFFVFFTSVTFAYDNGQVPVNTPESARRMIEDLIATHGEKYPKGPEYLKRLETVAEKMRRERRNREVRTEFDALLREAALANPLLDFDKIVLVRRNTQRG